MSEQRPAASESTRAEGQALARAGWESVAREAAHREAAAPEYLQQLLTFELDGAPYALAVERVREIVRVRPITPVPRVPEDVRGVISLRGEIVQVVDLRRRLGLEPVAATRASRIVVVHAGDDRIAGLLVDAVREVVSVREDALRPAPGESDAVEALCVRGEEFVSLVDLDRVLAVDAHE
ncbi:MAG: chemotaxis protein CheW [Myxococcota bacterium]